MKRRGFTLTEILVVIVILAILAALLIPTFARAKMNAKVTAAKLNLKGFWTGLQMYRQDNDEKVEYGSVVDMGLPPPPMSYTYFLQSYSKDPNFKWDNHPGLCPCGFLVNNEPWRGMFYFGYGISDWARDVERYKADTVILADKNCNTSDVKLECQYCDKRSIGITVGGQLKDRHSNEWPIYEQRFYLP